MGRIFVCGDVVNMFSPNQFVGENLRSIIKSANYAIANLEGCEFSGHGVVPKMMQYPETLSLLKDAGFDLLLMANNHIADYGEESLMYTLTEANRVGLKYVGAGFNYNDVYCPEVVCIDGTKIGILNLCEAHPHYYYNCSQRYGYAWIGDPNIRTRIEKIRLITDKVIAFIHGGLEHCTCPIGYFRDYYHWLCDCGVDAVIGGHPHISQGIERYNDKLICYSLGNFFFPRRPESDSSDVENHSFSLVLELDKSRIDYEIVYHKMDNLITEIEPEEESPVKARELSIILSSGNYERIHSATIKKYYESLVSDLYHSSLNTMRVGDSFMHRLKRAVKYVFVPDRLGGNSWLNNKNFVHLINNETYRYIVNEYLKEFYAGEHR